MRLRNNREQKHRNLGYSPRQLTISLIQLRKKSAASDFAHRRKLEAMETCPRCVVFSLLERKSPDKQHVLSNCGSPTALRRYTVRHNEVLSLIINWLRSSLSANQLIYADLSGSDILPVGDLFNGFRPDIAIADDN